MPVIRPAVASDRPELARLIQEMIPHVDVAARLRWLYDDSPGGQALTWLALSEKGELAGCTSLFPFRMWLDGSEVRGALGGDGFVRPAFRRQGIGGLLHDRSRQDMHAHGLRCMYGAPGAMNVTPLKHGGSRQVDHVARWVRPLRWRAISESPRFAATLGRVLGTTRHRDRADGAETDPPGMAGTSPGGARPGILGRIRARGHAALDPMGADDPRVDEIWNQTRGELALAAIRDRRFYTWRFHQAPAQRQPAYVIVEGDHPIGACALELLYEGRFVRIVDLLAPQRRWSRCLTAIARHCAEQTTADWLELKLMVSDGRRRRLASSLFIERDRKPFLCMIPPGGDRRFHDPDRWFYTSADSDLDDHR